MLDTCECGLFFIQIMAAGPLMKHYQKYGICQKLIEKRWEQMTKGFNK